MTEDSITVIELHYLPSVVVFAHAAFQKDVLRLEALEHYQKRSYRNRCRIAGTHGVMELSIPLLRGKHDGMPIRDVRIAWDTPWARTHWRTIVSAYGNSPFFDHYRDGLAPLFEKRPAFLWDWNISLFTWLWDRLALPGHLDITSSWEFPGPSGVIDRRGFYIPQDRHLVPTFPHVAYGQVFQDRNGFLPGLSALDLLFCTGPGALGVLRGMRHEPIQHSSGSLHRA